MARQSTAVRNRAGKVIPPRLRLTALLTETKREWERVYKRDKFESATCRELAEAVKALTRAALVEQHLRERLPRQRQPKHNRDDPQWRALRHLNVPGRADA